MWGPCAKRRVSCSRGASLALIAATLLGLGVVVPGGIAPAVGAEAPSAVSDGLMVHWDASETASLRDATGGSIDDGDTIGSWIDLVNGVTAAAVTSTGGVGAPVYRATGGAGGTPVVDFTAASSHGLETAAMALFATTNSGLTVIAVFDTDQVATQSFLVTHDTEDCVTNVEIGLAIGARSGSWGVHRGCGDADASLNNTLTVATPYIVTTTLATSDVSPRHVTHRSNGRGIANRTLGSGFTPAGSYPTTSAHLRLGFRQEGAASANSFFDGRMNELMIFDRPLSTDRVSEIEHQLATKHSIAAFPPTAPSPLSLSPEATAATIAWTAPADGGSMILGYDVTVSAAGAMVAGCSAPPGTTSCSVTGLGPATLHTVTVTATNVLGTGPGSTVMFTTAASSIVAIPPPPPTTTVTDVVTTTPTTGPTPGSVEDGSDPEGTPPATSAPSNEPVSPGSALTVTPGFVVATEDGSPIEVTLDRLTLDTWRVRGPGFELEFAPRDAAGSTRQVTDSDIATLVTGGSLDTSGSGFAASSIVEVWLFSEPRLLGLARVDASGRFQAGFDLPTELVAGDHRVQVEGMNPQGRPRVIGLGVVVAAGSEPTPSAPGPPADGRLPDTGAVPLAAAVIALVLGICGLGARRLTRHG